jgi:hypothetical protein
MFLFIWVFSLVVLCGYGLARLRPPSGALEGKKPNFSLTAAEVDAEKPGVVPMTGVVVMFA